MENQPSFLDRFFHLSENGTTVRTEILAGITTFMTMAYILAVNPTIMSAAGMDKGAVLTATALASLIGTLCMAFFANYPFALAPGMGLNAFFAFTVVLQMGYTWEMALAAVFFEGVIFIILSLTNVREAIFNAIPMTLKKAVSAGIGLFIALIGLLNAPDHRRQPGNQDCPVLVQTVCRYGYLPHCRHYGSPGHDRHRLHSRPDGQESPRQHPLGHPLYLDPGHSLRIDRPLRAQSGNEDVQRHPRPVWRRRCLCPASLSPILGQLDFSRVFSLDFLVVMFAFLFVDIFDTLGTLIGVSSKANMLDERGRLPRIKGALLADAVATTVGAVIGTSTTTTFVESATGVSEGGRTGLTAIVSGVLFLVCIFLSPLFLMIPTAVTGVALIFVGFSMLSGFTKLDFSDFKSCFGPFVMILFGTFTGDIAAAICLGVLTDVLIKVLDRR